MAFNSRRIRRAMANEVKKNNRRKQRQNSAGSKQHGRHNSYPDLTVNRCCKAFLLNNVQDWYSSRHMKSK